MALLGFPLSSGKILLPLTGPQLYFPAVPQPAIPPPTPAPHSSASPPFLPSAPLSLIMPRPALTSSRILPISSCFPGSSRPQFHPCLLLPPMLGSGGTGWWSPSSLPHPISSLKARGLCSFGGPLPAPPGQMLDWQAVAMGTSRPTWCRDISFSHLFWVIGTPGPSTLHLLTEGLAGICRWGVCVGYWPKPKPSDPSLLLSPASGQSHRNPLILILGDCPSSLSLPCGPSLKVAAHPFGSPWLLE